MVRIKLLAVIATISISLLSSYKVNAQLYCQWWDGVYVRDSSSVDSDQIGKIEFGEKIEEREAVMHEIINDRSGDWLKINYKGEVGYVYSAFFGSQRIIEMNAETGFREYIMAMLDLYIEDSIVYSVDNHTSILPGLSGKLYYNIYEDATISYTHFGYECEIKTFITDRISPNEFLNILNTYYHMAKNKSYFKPVYKSAYVGKENYMTYEICINENNCIFKHFADMYIISIVFSDYPSQYYWCDLMDYEVVEEIDKECLAHSDSNVSKAELVRPYKGSRELILVATVESGGSTFRDIFDENLRQCRDPDMPMYQLIQDAKSDSNCKLELYNMDCHSYYPVYSGGWKNK